MSNLFFSLEVRKKGETRRSTSVIGPKLNNTAGVYAISRSPANLLARMGALS